MNQIIEILRGMRRRPGMYFGRNPPGIDHLHAFFLGVQTGAFCGGDLKILEVFEEWVCWRYGDPRFNFSSFEHIRRNAEMTGESAFNLYFEYLEGYLSEYQRIGPEGIRALIARRN